MNYELAIPILSIYWKQMLHICSPEDMFNNVQRSTIYNMQ